MENTKENGGARRDDATPAQQAKQKPGTVARLWAKAGLDLPTLMLMTKAGLPPIICLCAYEADSWALKYSNLGYLAAIMSLLALCIQPRAKFMQSIIISIFFVCVGAAVALLQIQCVVSARQRTTMRKGTNAVGFSGSSESSEYNSSASVVAAVFLFVTIYGASLLRAKRPQLMLPSIQYSIFTIVASTYAPQFPNMTAGLSFVNRMLQTFLTGFGIAMGVSLFIIPVTSRNVTEKQMAGCLDLMKAGIAAHGKYMISITKNLRVPKQESNSNGRAKQGDKVPTADMANDPASATSAEATAMKGLLASLGELFGKVKLEMSFAKKELAYGYLMPKDYSHIFDHLRGILLPILGLSTFINVMQAVKENNERQKCSIDSRTPLEAIRRLKSDEWDEVITMSHEQYSKLQDWMMEGLTHVSYTLRLVKKPKIARNDAEKASRPGPGHPGFTGALETAIHDFKTNREHVIERWCTRAGIELPQSFWEEPEKHHSFKDLEALPEAARRRANQQQLYLILYIEYMLWCIGEATLKMVRYADSKVDDGTMKKKRIIIPAWRQLAKLWRNAFERSDTHESMDNENAGVNIWVGDSLRDSKKDPEHLPPTNAFQKVTDYFRLVPRHFASDESAFAFRAAVATLSIGILCYIRETNLFFLKERGLWALIMIAVSMTPHAGQGVFGFVARIVGTAIAMVVSIAIWYIGGQKTPAILVLFYVYICLGFWFVIKTPKLAIVGILSVVTGILIVGYELQERKIGLALATSNGQPFYQIYILAPYRLATVVVGLVFCFVWTYIPYPVTTHSTLRKDLGKTLYTIANYYSCIHTTVQLKLKTGATADPEDRKSPIARLDKARHNVFGRCLLMLNRLREHSTFTKFEPTFGGKFPKQTYDELIQHMQNIFNYMSMISYSSNTFGTEPQGVESAWLKDFRKFTGELKITSHEMTSMLCLVSASMVNRQPLPPYLTIPQPYGISERLESVDPQLLSVKHVTEPCYAAFAVLEVAASLVTEEMAQVMKKVQDLVGEVDFSFHPVSTSADDSLSSLTDDRDTFEKAKEA